MINELIVLGYIVISEKDNKTKTFKIITHIAKKYVQYRVLGIFGIFV